MIFFFFFSFQQSLLESNFLSAAFFSVLTSNEHATPFLRLCTIHCRTSQNLTFLKWKKNYLITPSSPLLQSASHVYSHGKECRAMADLPCLWVLLLLFNMIILRVSLVWMEPFSSELFGLWCLSWPLLYPRRSSS